jgi:succinoglycan biosynthesis protein ExoV
MKLSFWDGPNFGDQLNRYIFPRLFADLLDDGNDTALYGIGSVIDLNIIPKIAPAVLFGTGLRDPFREYDGHNWDIRFLRGPLSVRSFSPATRYIADAAYLLTLIEDFRVSVLSTSKRFKVSLIPYFSYVKPLPWRKLCALLDFHFIDPSGHPDHVLREIAASDFVVAGAMHGAIIADICRVPWLRLRMDQYPSESFFLSEFKWADWASALEIEETPSVSLSSVDLRTPVTRAKRVLFLLEACSRLRSLQKCSFQLSKDEVLRRVIGKLDDEKRRLIDDYMA